MPFKVVSELEGWHWSHYSPLQHLRIQSNHKILIQID